MIRIASVALPKSPMNLAQGDEVPQIITRRAACVTTFVPSLKEGSVNAIALSVLVKIKVVSLCWRAFVSRGELVERKVHRDREPLKSSCSILSICPDSISPISFGLTWSAAMQMLVRQKLYGNLVGAA